MRFKIKAETIQRPKKLESGVPVALTEQLLSDFETGRSFGSAAAEDLIISALQKDLSPVEIARTDKSELEQKILSAQSSVSALAEQVAWSEIANHEIAEQIKTNIVEDIRTLGANDEQIEAFLDTSVTFNTEPGTSLAGNQSVNINLPQIARKVSDTIQGLELEGEQTLSVAGAMVRRVVGHELGHIADEILNRYSNSVQRDSRWGEPNESQESRIERFAEMFGVRQLDTHESELLHQSQLLNVAKTRELWSAIKNYNERNNTDVDVFDLFEAVERSINHPHAKAFLESRKYLYSTAVPENYAMPYDFDEVKSLHT